jgi:invasion protein IalB
MRATTRIALTLGGLAFGFAATSALAQQSQPADTIESSASPRDNLSGTAPIAFQSQKGGYSTWVKFCEKNGATDNKEICLVNNETIDTTTGLTVVAAGVRKIDGGAKEQLFVTLPQSALLALPAGAWVDVDGNEPVSLAYGYCYGMSCEAQVEFGKDLLAKFRKGKQLSVAFVNLQGQAHALPVDLTGFSKAYDGPPADAAKYREARGKLIEALRQRQAALAAQVNDRRTTSPMGEGPSPSQPQPAYPDGPPKERGIDTPRQ